LCLTERRHSDIKGVLILEYNLSARETEAKESDHERAKRIYAN
jgi:hypothetical protein